MKFVVGCDLEEFKRYYRRNGYDDGDLEHLIKKSLRIHLNLLSGEKTTRLLVMQFGMNLTQGYIGREILETKRIQKH